MKKKKKSKSRSSGTFGYLLGSVALVVVIGGVMFAAVKVGQEVGYDESTLCEVNGADHAKVVLLDLTDPLSPTQASRLKTMIDQEIEKSPANTMLSLGIVSDDPQDWGARFSLCKPRSGADASDLYENPRMIAKNYRDHFERPLSAALSSTMSASEASSSPIMEALQSLIADTPDFNTVEGNRELIIVSDMLQHSDTLSAYRGQGWDHFEASGYADRLAENMQDVSVRVIRIPRQTEADKSLSDDFWARYFDRQGAGLPSVIILGDL
jgi:hypothetical protein